MLKTILPNFLHQSTMVVQIFSYHFVFVLPVLNNFSIAVFFIFPATV